MTGNEPGDNSDKLIPAGRLPSGLIDHLMHYWYLTKELVLKPKLFFENMPQSGGFQEPTLYLAVSCVGYALLNGLLTFKLLGIIPAALSAFVGTFVVAGVALGLSKAMGAKGTFEANFRAFAYISCMRLLYPIPAIGAIAALYGLFLTYLALSKVQGLTPVKTCVIVFLTGFLAGVIMFVGGLAALFHP